MVSVNPAMEGFYDVPAADVVAAIADLHEGQVEATAHRAGVEQLAMFTADQGGTSLTADATGGTPQAPQFGNDGGQSFDIT